VALFDLHSNERHVRDITEVLDAAAAAQTQQLPAYYNPLAAARAAARAAAAAPAAAGDGFADGVARRPQLSAAAAAAAAGAAGVGVRGLFGPGGHNGRRMISPSDEGRDQQVSELLASHGWMVESSGPSGDGSVLRLVR
jgi:hypothetical protein